MENIYSIHFFNIDYILYTKKMLSCEDCKNRAIAESQKLRQIDGESARDFYTRILNHFRIWDRFYFGLRRENLDVALDAYLNDLSIDEIIDIISESEKKNCA
jgi:hypothetical protein